MKTSKLCWPEKNEKGRASSACKYVPVYAVATATATAAATAASTTTAADSVTDGTDWEAQY